MKEITISMATERPQDFDNLELIISDLFKSEIYQPLMDELYVIDNSKVLNSPWSYLSYQISQGRIRYHKGKFHGRLNAKISKELKSIGAKWSKSEKVYKLPMSKLPEDIKFSISASIAKFDDTIKAIKRKIAQLLPEQIADKLAASKIFDDSIYKTDKDINRSLKGITVSPTLTEEARAKLASEYNNNMKRYIQGWTEDEIIRLRSRVEKLAMDGGRYENLVKIIQQRYDVSKSKAKFLARQETGLLMAKFRESRYVDAGSEGYYWKNVFGSPAHPVRPRHKALADTYHRWDNPPITSDRGDRNHPGEDYGCRCTARVVMRF